MLLIENKINIDLTINVKILSIQMCGDLGLSCSQRLRTGLLLGGAIDK